MGNWTLLIDLGGALTIAAALQDDSLGPIDLDGVPPTPSAVCWSESRGELLAGGAAERVSAAEPWRGEERLGSRLREDHLLLAGKRVPVVDAVAALLAHVTRQVSETAGGRPPAAVWMTAPTRSAEVAQLRAAANAAGLGHAVLVPTAVAVAASLPRARLRPGDRVAVYDLGATCFDASVLVCTEDSFEPTGRPRRVEGGEDEFDRKLVRSLNERLAREERRGGAPDMSEESLSRAGRAFSESVRAAREQLSGAMTASVRLPPPLDGALGISRAEFESLIEGDVRETVSQLGQAIAEAGGVSAVCLAGGGARIALVGRLIADELGLTAEADTDPGTAAVRGLAELARQAQRNAPVALAAEGQSEPDGVNALDEDVQFTVYRPQSVAPGRWYTLLAFAHKSDPAMDEILGVCDPVEEVRSQAAARLGPRLSSYARTEQDSSLSIARGSELTFAPRAHGVEFNPPVRTFCWQEPVHQEEFRIRADARLRGTRARGVVAVYLGALLIAEVSLNIRVGDAPEAVASGAERARPYRRIFFSYSRKDKAVVDQVEQVLLTLGDEVMRDTQTLRAGEVWDERIEQMICDAEIFQLFWSTHSMTSKFVSKEWRYALALRRPNFIRPTYWEQPMPELPDADLPPAQLRKLHFHPLPASAIRHLRSGSTTTTGAAPGASNPQAVPPSAPVSMPPAAPVPPAPAPPAPAFLPPPEMASQSGGLDGTGAARQAPGAARRAPRPPIRSMRATAWLSGLVLIALVGGVVGGLGLAGSGPSSRPPAQTVTATTEERVSTTPPTRSPRAPSCADCRAAGRDCPDCVVREGTGSTDIGPITSARGFLTWRNEGGGPFVLMLDGRVVVYSTAAGGRLALPQLAYSDLRIDAPGMWSVAIH